MDTINPLNPIEINPAGEQALEYGTFWERLGALLIDVFIISAATYILSSLGAFGASLGFIGSLVYFPIFESSLWQATPGKRTLNLVVTDEFGQRIPLGRAIGRYLGRLLSGLILGIGFLIMLGDPKRQTLHDKIARTLVVKRKGW